MKPEDYPQLVEALCAACHRFGERGWCRATSGNFSTRVDNGHCLITRSGCDKSRLAVHDLMICDSRGKALDQACQSSAETPLHARLYALDPSIGAVLHTHSVTGTTLSRCSGPHLYVRGYEMQKALAGITSHEEQVVVRVFDNNQDMPALAEELTADWNAGNLHAPGFLIAGHGLYAWGRDVCEAERHVEGFEFLFDCLWQEKLAGLS